MPIHGITIPAIFAVDNITIQSTGAPATLSIKAPYRNSIYNSVRVGTILSWVKTFNQIVNDVTDGTTAGKLIDSSVDFITLGIEVGDIVVDDTGGSWTSVTAVDDLHTLSVADDIFVNGDAYRIFDTPALPEGWVECNGQVINDPASRWNGLNTPDLNTTQSFARGATESGATGGTNAHTHDLPIANSVNSFAFDVPPTYGTGANIQVDKRITTVGGGPWNWARLLTNTASTLPVYYEVVKILKIREST